MKKILTLFVVGHLCVALQAFSAEPEGCLPSHKGVKVFISQVAEHPALDKTRRGIIDALSEAGYQTSRNLKLRYESAQANPALAQQIAIKFTHEKPDVVVGIGTVSAHSFLKFAEIQSLKVIFSSVTDPVGAGLVKTVERPGGTVSGVSNYVDILPQLQLFKKLLPTLTKLGVLYNPGEANSVSLIQQLERVCPSLGLTLVTRAANKTAEIAQSAASLVPGVDAIFISNDNTALSALGSIFKAAGKKIPVFVSDVDAVQQGALAALGPNQYEVGKQTGRMVVRILQGQPIAEQRVEFPNRTELYINLGVARKLGLVVPAEILKTAAKVIGE